MGSQGDRCTVTWLIYIIIVFEKNALKKKKKIKKLVSRKRSKRERKTMETTGFKTYLPYKEMIFNVHNITSMTNCFIFLIQLWIQSSNGVILKNKLYKY